MLRTDPEKAAESLAARFRRLDPTRVGLDKARVEACFRKHLRALGLDPLPVHWAADLPQAYLELARPSLNLIFIHAGCTPSNYVFALTDLYWRSAIVIRSKSRDQRASPGVADFPWLTFERLRRLEREALGSAREQFASAADSAARSMHAVASRGAVVDAPWSMAERATEDAAFRAVSNTTLGAASEKAATGMWHAAARVAERTVGASTWAGITNSLLYPIMLCPAWVSIFCKEYVDYIFRLDQAMFERTRDRARSSVRPSALWQKALQIAEKKGGHDLSESEVQHWMDIWLPFADALQAGLWMYWIGEQRIIAVPRPVFHIQGERLHCADGPAVLWPQEARFWFWRGIEVPQRLIEKPDHITVDEIQSEPNTEIRRVLLERFGEDRFLKKIGAKPQFQDEFGTLYRMHMAGSELCLIKVINATAEPNGSFRNYFLQVPPHIRTAHEGVAWTFGMTAKQYRPSVQT